MLQAEIFILNVENVTGNVANFLPVAILHGAIGHQLKERTGFVEVFDSL